MSNQDIFMLVDGHALIYRAFHAFPDLTSPDGRLVNAVYGFTRNVLTAIRDFHPEYAAVTFDHPEKTRRATEFADYKANRAEMPLELQPQIPLVKEIVDALGMPQFEQAGFEADDLIGTISTKLADSPVLTLIVTGDRDLLQLVDENTHVWLPARGKNGEAEVLDRQGVFKKMGVWPEQITDLKALMGDASDNIPGVKGVGEKTAAALITEFGSIEKLYARLESKQTAVTDLPKILTKKNLVEKLLTDKENAFLSKRLATIDTKSPVSFELEDCRVQTYDKDKAAALFESLAFNSLVRLLPTDEFEQGIQETLFN